MDARNDLVQVVKRMKSLRLKLRIGEFVYRIILPAYIAYLCMRMCQNLLRADPLSVSFAIFNFLFIVVFVYEYIRYWIMTQKKEHREMVSGLNKHIWKGKEVIRVGDEIIKSLEDLLRITKGYPRRTREEHLN